MGKTYTQGEVLTALDLNASLSEAVNTDGYFVFTANPSYDQSQYPFMSGEHIHNAKVTLNSGLIVNTSNISVNTGNISVNTGNISVNTGNISVIGGNISTSSGTISDQDGNLRSLKKNTVASNYTIQSSDNGRFINAPGNVIMPANIFNIGDNVTIYNNSKNTTYIRQGDGSTLTMAGLGITGDAANDPNGMSVIICVDTNQYVVSTAYNNQVSSGSGGGGGSSTYTLTSSGIDAALGYVPVSQDQVIALLGGTSGFVGITSFTTSGIFTVPNGITRCKVTLIGAGGGTATGSTDSKFGTYMIAYAGTMYDIDNFSSGDGGSATGGDINITGGTGDPGSGTGGGGGFTAMGGTIGRGRNGILAGGYRNSNPSPTGGAGGGGYCVKYVTGLTTGQQIPVTVTGNGICIVEY